MTRKSFIIACCFISLGLVSCDPGGLSQLPASVQTAAIQTVVVAMTQTAAPMSKQDPALTPSIDSSGAVTLTPGASLTFAPTLTSTSSLPCDAAAAGRPIDVTIPDDTVLPAGTSFTKIWRLVNTGSCTWTVNYAVVWFSGDQMGATTTQNLSRQVKSGESIDVAVDLNVPNETGVKQSYWKLRNADYELFGIGPAGNSPFWVRIVVAENPVAQATATPEPTATPIVLVQGSLDLVPGESLNLDSGEKTPAGSGDLNLENGGDSLQLRPEVSVMLAVTGSTPPSQSDCRLISQGSEPVILDGLPMGTYFCYQTDQGLPGYARLTDINTAGIRLDFNTWAVP